MNLLEALSYPQLERLAPNSTLIFGVGATEQHGPHLPVSTNSIITNALASSLAKLRADRVVLAPPINFGSSEEHSSFCGTISLGNELLERVLIQVARSAKQFYGVGFVTAHGGNANVIAQVAASLTTESQRVFAWWPTFSALTEAAFKWSGPGDSPGLEHPDIHAGRTETSAMLALSPTLVKMEKIVSGPLLDLDDVSHEKSAFDMQMISGNGVLGDPNGASASEGSAIMGALTDSMLRAFDNYLHR